VEAFDITFPLCLSTIALLWTEIPVVSCDMSDKVLGPKGPKGPKVHSWSSPALLAVSGRDQHGRDDDEDQHSAVLWLSFQEGGGQEAGVEGARGREALATGVPTRSPLREWPQEGHCGSSHEAATTPTR
jgi:hypothetical protein